VALDNLFGATQCRSLWYCRSCRQPFEGFKSLGSPTI
jgi:ring-1,2-phenylacetyl-CoA epoxidase subunit PaaD